MLSSFDGYYNLGRIAKRIGNDGECQAIIDTTNPEEYIELESVFVEQNGSLIPFFIYTLQFLSKTKIRLQFEDVGLSELAPLIGHGIYLPLSSLPILDDKTFYHFEVEGFTAVDDTNNETIGIVEQVVDNPGHPIIVVFRDEKEILIPKTEEIFKKIDRKNKTLYLSLPPGLLDIYLS